MTHLMLTKDLGIARRANASLGATRAVYAAPRRTKPPRGPAGQNARRHGVAAPALRPIPSGARAHARGATCARTGSRHAGAAPVGTPRPIAPPAGWCLQSPGTLGRPGATRRAPPGTGGRRRLDTITRERDSSGCANRRNLPTARRSDVVVELEFHNREKRHLEIGVTGVAISAGDARRREPAVAWQPPVVRSAQLGDRGPLTVRGRRGYRNRGIALVRRHRRA